MGIESEVFMKFLNLMFRNGPFVVSLIAVLAIIALAFIKGTNIESLLPTVLGIYLGHKVSTGISSHWAASKDPNCDTQSVIRDTEGIEVKQEIEK
jgi:hypothetical protein